MWPHWTLSFIDFIDVVDAEATDVETLFEIYLNVVATGGADPAGGEAIWDVFVGGWIRRRRVYAARRDGVAMGGSFLRSSFARHRYRSMMFNLAQESNPSRRLYERADFQVIGRVPPAHGDESSLTYWGELPSVESAG